MDEADEIVSVIPIHYSDALVPNIHVHQFPLLTRSLQVPPAAAASGKRMRVRYKPSAGRLEIHIPVDTRPEVRNLERSKILGAALLVDDRDRHCENKGKMREDDEPRLSEMRLRSEAIVQKGTYVLGITKDEKLYLHPISEIHQLRPSLTYLDVLSRKGKRSRAGESDPDSDDGPPLDPDDPLPPPPKKEKKPPGEAKEVHVTARKTDDAAGLGQGGISAIRREMLHIIRTEEEEKWEIFDFCDVTTGEPSTVYESIFSTHEEPLDCTTNLTTFMTSIKGL